VDNVFIKKPPPLAICGNYIIWCGGCLTTQLLCEKRTKGHDRRRRKANDTIAAHSQQQTATATATKGNKNNSWLPFVSEFHFIIAFIATLPEREGESPTAQLPAIPAVWSFIVFVVLLLLAVLLLLGHKENSIKTQQYRTPSSKLSPQLAPSSPPSIGLVGRIPG